MGVPWVSKQMGFDEADNRRMTVGQALSIGTGGSVALSSGGARAGIPDRG
jgi:hypothetical protein